MSKPFVVACCPARNRAWVLPQWYLSLLAQTRLPDIAYVLLNDCVDDSVASLDQFWVDDDNRGGRLRAEQFNTGIAGDHRIAPRYSTTNLGNLRNEMLTRVLARWPQLTHVWSVDSDVVPDANVLELLLAADLPIVAAVVRNSVGEGVYNYMCGWRRGYGGPAYPYRDGTEASKLDRADPFVVSMTGACVLIRRDVLDAGVRYADHAQGEDIAWSLDAQRRGYILSVHPLARTSHIQKDGDTWRA